MNLSNTLIPAAANLLLGLIAIPFYIRYAQRKNIVDIPNHRSSHTIATPRGGGIFMAFGTLLLAGISLIWNQPPTAIFAFLPIASAIAILGLIDDLKPIPSILRLGIQIILTVTLFAFFSKNLKLGILDQQLSSDILFIWIIGAGFTIWSVGCLNIYNFMDGIDGIATLQGITAATTWAIIAYTTQNNFTLLLSLLLLGGLLAFLRDNWPPAKVFMGDCASSFLGFAFAALPLLHANHTDIDLWQSINLSALILFPFLFDGAFTIFRRLSKRENILEAHRSHLYQRWTQSGATHKHVSVLYGLWGILGGISALLVHFDHITLLSAYIIVLLPALCLLIYSKCFSPSNPE